MIYLKNSRDKVYLMTDKRVTYGTEEIPECEHGYWGGFSPTRKGKYENKDLSKQYASGRARLYPSARKLPGSLKKSATPKKDHARQAANFNGIKVDSLDEIGLDSVFPSQKNPELKVSISNERANAEMEKMRDETRQANTEENMLTENGTVSAGKDKRSDSNAANNSSADEDLFLHKLEKDQKHSRSNSVVNAGSKDHQGFLKQNELEFKDPYEGKASKVTPDASKKAGFGRGATATQEMLRSSIDQVDKLIQ